MEADVMPEFQFTLGEPTTKDGLLAELRRLHEASSVFWEAFSTEEFFAAVGGGWSPAGNVRHLNKSIGPLARALRLPRLALLVLFGKARRPSRTYAGLRDDYLAMLEKGAGAGSFAPEPASEMGNDARRRVEVMAKREDFTRQLWSAIGSWREQDLDRYVLPHPLLGKLTLREMLCFTLYHNYHHVRNVAARLQSAARVAAP
jgi:DinB family protein